MDNENEHTIEEQNNTTEIGLKKKETNEPQLNDKVMDIIGNGQLIKKVGVYVWILTGIFISAHSMSGSSISGSIFYVLWYDGKVNSN